VAKFTDANGRSRSGEEGATVVEYVLMLVLIAIVSLGAVAQIGGIDALFFSIGNTL
jgi:Flp pilus assembly pilin Flp